MGQCSPIKLKIASMCNTLISHCKNTTFSAYEKILKSNYIYRNSDGFDIETVENS